MASNNYFTSGGKQFLFDDRDYFSALDAWRDACRAGKPLVYRPFRLSRVDPWTNVQVIGCMSREAAERAAMDEFDAIDDLKESLEAATKDGRERYVAIVDGRIKDKTQAIRGLMRAAEESERMWMEAQRRLDEEM